MTHYGGKELARSFRTVRNNTITIAEEIPEDRYDFKPAADARSVRELLSHIAFIPRLQQQMQTDRVTDVGTVNFTALLQPIFAEAAKPRTKAEIVALLAAERDRFTTYLDALTDAFLAEPVAQGPGAQPATKSRLEMLMSPKEHEMHHRGQLMLIERMIGVVPHLTRQMQARLAQGAQSSPAGQ
jgi:uncharacterized damage-inducible protein DinB